MQAGPESLVVSSFDQTIGELTGPGGSVPQAGDGAIAAGGQAGSAGGGGILVGPLALSFERVARRRHQLTARRRDGGDVIAVDTIELARAGQRQRFIDQILEKLDLAEPEAGALGAGLDQALLQLASAPPPSGTSGHAATAEAEFQVVDDAGDPELAGLYTTMPPAQIANFDMRIVEKVLVADEDRQETRLRLVLRRHGQ